MEGFQVEEMKQKKFAKDTKIDTEVELSWVNNIHPQNQTRFKLGY